MNTYKQITRADERGRSRTNWLDSRHSFSFGSYLDPERMGFGPLRVVNDDRVAPGGGFPAHPHRDMEIVSIVLEGELEHKDSMGNGRVIKSGEIQYMSAGSGITHSEFNPSPEQPVHFLQIWIQPAENGLTPRYADQPLEVAANNEWSLVLSPEGRDASIAIRQDVELRSVLLDAGRSIVYVSAVEGRGLWIFVIEGRIKVMGEVLEKGDSFALAGFDAATLVNCGGEPARALLFDVPL